MALPSLPDQVVALILDHLKHCCFRSDKERRDTGVSVSLVCTKWYVLGQRIAWYAIALEWTDDERLVEGLLSRPEVLVKVARLSFTSQVPQPGEDLRPLDREAALKSVELVAVCPQLKALDVRFPGQDGYLLDAIADTRAEPTLDELKVSIVPGDGFTLSDLVETLARFRNAGHLESTICWPERPPVPRISRVAIYHLPVKTLCIHLVVFDQETNRRVCEALNTLVDASKTDSLFVTGLTADATSLGWLLRYSHLRAIGLFAPAGERITSSLPHITAALSTLSRLETVEIGLDPTSMEADFIDNSPVPLDRFLDALPPRIETYKVVGVIFADEMGLLMVPRVEHPADDVRVRILLVVREGGQLFGGLETLVRCARADSEKGWGVLKNGDEDGIGW